VGETVALLAMDGDCFVWLYFVDRFAGWEWLA
jgi:hypothetical protein